ncbi:FAD-dependent thymidylate synthase [Candidatus Woesearchaeota archaeon]|nr:FAD-dependent thymidylate synthase [Candidatus Woesearchaeota archaeon]
MADSFTDDEKKILEPYFTNLDKPVFAFTAKVPEEVVAVLFSKYSRSAHSIRKNFLDLVKDPESGFKSILDTVSAGGSNDAFANALVKARDFFRRILVEYGDDSVGELGIAHVACENVSQIAAKRLEDARLTSPLEKSTRYVVFEKGNYCKPAALANSRFSEDYAATCKGLFDAYSGQLEPMKAFVREKWPIAAFDLGGRKISEITDEAETKRAKSAYESAVKARALDILRYYLPAATVTNIGITANGRAFEYLASKLMSDELEEVREIGRLMLEELSKVIPSLVKRAAPSNYLVETRKAMHSFAAAKLSGTKIRKQPTVTFVSYDKEAEVKVVAAALYQFSHHPLSQLRKMARKMTAEERMKVVDEYMGKRSSRRERPLRAAETAYYQFDVLSDYGAYRDLQRHRIMTQIPQLLTVEHGYDTPQEIVEAGFGNEFHRCMKRAAAVYKKIAAEMPMEAQYVVPLAYRIRYIMQFNLREAYHLIELRSVPQGHPSYRHVVQEMFRQIKAVHPALVQYMRYVNLDELDALGRLKSELRKEEKIAAMEKGDT